MPVPTLGAPPARLDVDVRAGEPIDFSVPVLDAAGVALSLTGWTGAAQVRASAAGPLLHAFTVALGVGEVRVTATGVQTAGWTWRAACWDLVLTDPFGVSTLLVAGWVWLYPTITHS